MSGAIGGCLSATSRSGRHLEDVRPVLVSLVLLLLATTAFADRHVVVGTKQTPPFAIKNPDGTWTGLSIELWRQVADDLHITYEIRELDLKGLMQAVQDHQVDIAVGALTITSDRERTMDFTHPVFATGLAIATRPGGSGGLLGSLRGLLTWDIAKLLGGIFVLLAAIGALVWWFERDKNDAQFARHPARGIAAGIWWSAVTMTTVGYGDKSPVTVRGRLLGLVWMFSAIIIIAIFTATVTTNLTIDRLESAIKGPEDLPRVRVVSVGGSTSAAYLDAHHINYRLAPSPLEGMRAVARGEADAVVYDAPVLQYLAKSELGGTVTVLPRIFDPQSYGFALPEGSPLREELNRALLTALTSERWTQLVERYLGP
jgi:ABC-type amino acid transport substrate-binding protein